MGCGKATMVAREEDKGGQMVAGELEAAEALAGLARSSSFRGGTLASGELKWAEAVVDGASASESQDQPVAADQVCDYATTTIMSPEKIEKTVENIPSQFCSTSYQSNPVIKSRQKLTQAEKEERKLRRILANRESARQTIRRRQALGLRESVVQDHCEKAMYLELTRKAADVLEENESLKKEKELALKEYNSLKGIYEFLKAQLQLAEVKKAAAGETEEGPKKSEAEKSGYTSTTSTPVFLHNQPSIIPCFWPSILPSPDVIPFQCASHSHNTSLYQFPMPQGDMPCLHQGHDHSMGNTRPGTPFYVFPVPWLLPLFTHSSPLHSTSSTNERMNTRQCSRCSCPDTQPHEDSNQLSSQQDMRPEASIPKKTICTDTVHRAGFTLQPDSRGGQYDARHPTSAISVPGLFSPVRPLETLGHPWSCQVDDTSDINVISTRDSGIHGLAHRNQEPVICTPEKPEDVFAATMARRRRKELMKLKNVHYQDVRTRY